MRNTIHYIICVLSFLFGNLLAVLPLRILYLVSDFNYFIIYHIIKYRKEVVFDNLRLAFPEKSEKERIEIAKKFYHHFCDVLMEAVKLFQISATQLKQRMRVVNPEIITEEFNKGKHILAVIGHYNNWEWGISAGMQIPFHFASIYKPLSNKYFDKMMVRLRTKFGGDVIPMHQTARYLIKNMKDGKLTMLNFIADQSPMHHEIQYWATFFNIKTPVYLGIEKLAIKTKQPIYYAHFNKIRRGYYEITFQKICDDASILKPFELTDRHTKLLEDDIRKSPQYWLWSHKRWKFKQEKL
jgi:KDO2-lipid IV(A) lauroyltransferase